MTECDAPSRKPESKWHSLFSYKESKPQFHQPRVKVDKKSIFIPKPVHDQGVLALDDCLIGKFYESSPNIVQIKSIVNFLWGQYERVEAMSWGDDSFTFKFARNQTKDWVFEERP